jgi:flagellar biogenesis protein FliO
MGRWTWGVVLIGLAASITAVQFDEPLLEIAGSVGFVLLLAWVIVRLRRGVSTTLR